ncbi:MAG: nucleotidyltransferase domain-containing protein [Anaerolineales bacterium]|jgi:predicted nucleotidyltransferase
MLAYLFGSVAEGYALLDSDVDIALILKPACPLSRYERMQLEFNIAEKVERHCQVSEADVRCVDRAPLTVQGSVITKGVLLFSRDEEFRVDYEVYTRKRYFDFLPVAKMMQRAFFKSLSQEGLVVSRSR